MPDEIDLDGTKACSPLTVVVRKEKELLKVRLPVMLKTGISSTHRKQYIYSLERESERKRGKRKIVKSS